MVGGMWSLYNNYFQLRIVARLILSIMVGSMEYNDVIIWHYEKYGEYLVKIGYKVALKSNDFS